MELLDQLLENLGVKNHDELEPDEQKVYDKWLKALQVQEISPESIRQHITRMREIVEQKLSEEPEYITVLFFKFRNDKNVFLKARLRNYLMLEAYLTSPQRAKEQLERMVSGMIRKV